MKQLRMSPLRYLPVLIGLPWLLPGAQVAVAQTKVSIIVNLIVGSSLLPLWIAQEQGLFARQGIDGQVLLGARDPSRQIGDDVPFGVIGTAAVPQAARRSAGSFGVHANGRRATPGQGLVPSGLESEASQRR